MGAGIAACTNPIFKEVNAGSFLPLCFAIHLLADDMVSTIDFKSKSCQYSLFSDGRSFNFNFNSGIALPTISSCGRAVNQTIKNTKFKFNIISCCKSHI